MQLGSKCISDFYDVISMIQDGYSLLLLNGICLGVYRIEIFDGRVFMTKEQYLN